MAEESAFAVGDLVEHKRYGYRGVVAGRDDHCRASDAWYYNNQTQPSRHQAWYHVLVHGGQHTTYVAEEHLQPDEGGEQVVHPLTKHYFEYFAKGRYHPRDDVTFESEHAPEDCGRRVTPLDSETSLSPRPPSSGTLRTRPCHNCAVSSCARSTARP